MLLSCKVWRWCLDRFLAIDLQNECSSKRVLTAHLELLDMQVSFMFSIVIYTQNIKIINLLGYCLQLLAFTSTLHLKGRGFISSDLKGSLFLFHEIFPLTPSKSVSINTLCNINYVIWEGLCPEFIACQQYCWITMLVFWVWRKRLFQPSLFHQLPDLLGLQLPFPTLNIVGKNPKNCNPSNSGKYLFYGKLLFLFYSHCIIYNPLEFLLHSCLEQFYHCLLLTLRLPVDLDLA